ncbi:MAG: hypothetical protein OXH15_00540 [Gammaproteobacteria bacterium]|nr:hypothetical protein [Gammaproteobacteria bacterium]
MDAELAASLAKVRRVKRRERIKALPRETKEALVAKLLRRRQSRMPMRQAAG